MKKNKEKYIYLIKDQIESCYKIGVAKEPQKRINQLQTGNSNILEIVHIYKSNIPNKVEKALHNQFSSFKVNNEWFNFSLEEEINFLENCKKIEYQLKYIQENKI